MPPTGRLCRGKENRVAFRGMVRRLSLLNLGWVTTLQLAVVNLHDINAINQHQRSVDKDHEPPLICVEKWARLRHRATAFGDYVPPTHEEMALKYLRRELQSVSPGDDFDQALQTMSRAVKGQEDEITARRTGL
jgi:hypothetical protein